MPIQPFDGQTFVAFIDISGFKLMMNNNETAIRALQQFYQAGYDTLNTGNAIEGFFISDCGILFCRSGQAEEQLEFMLAAVKTINRRMLTHEIILTTAIAYGHFNYTDRAEFDGIEKNAIYGEAYLNAYLDNANGKPKLRAGQCRLLLSQFPPQLADQLRNYPLLVRKGRNYLQYYWNVDEAREIADFENRYNDSYNQRFAGMLKALKGIGGNHG